MRTTETGQSEYDLCEESDQDHSYSTVPYTGARREVSAIVLQDDSRKPQKSMLSLNLGLIDEDHHGRHQPSQESYSTRNKPLTSMFAGNVRQSHALPMQDNFIDIIVE